MDGQWPKYDQSAPRPKSSPLGSKSEIAASMDNLHEIHGLVKLEDYDEVKQSAAALNSTAVQGTTTSSSPKEDTEIPDNEYLSKLKS